MAIDRSFLARNACERERLAALVGRLGEAELTRSVGHGWTVAATLVHLAFWDLRAVRLMDQYETSGVTPSPADVDVLNDTVQALGATRPPGGAPGRDRAGAALKSPSVLTQNFAGGGPGR